MRSEANGSGRKSSHNEPTRKTLTFLEQGSFRLSLFSSGKSNDQMGLDKFFVTSLTVDTLFKKTWHSILVQRTPNTQIDAWFWSQQGRRALALVLFPSHQRPMPTRWHNDIIMEEGSSFEWLITARHNLRWTPQLTWTPPPKTALNETTITMVGLWPQRLIGALTPVFWNTSASQQLIGRARGISFQQSTPLGY